MIHKYSSHPSPWCTRSTPPPLASDKSQTHTPLLSGVFRWSSDSRTNQFMSWWSSIRTPGNFKRNTVYTQTSQRISFINLKKNPNKRMLKSFQQDGQISLEREAWKPVSTGKFNNICQLESQNQVWNRIQLGLLPGQLSFLLRASSDTLLTPLNLKRWKLRVDAKCDLCGDCSPTVLHILNGCPVALNQSWYTWRHDSVLKKID